jgi:hypothetical protein
MAGEVVSWRPDDPSGTHPVHDKTLTYLHLQPSGALPPLGQLAPQSPPFQAILIVEDEADEVDELWQFDLCRAIAASNCRYLLAWGDDCAAWRDAVEDAVLEAADYEDLPPDRVVLTTAHEDEDLDEVFWFARRRAAHPALLLHAVVILHVAPRPDRERLEAAWREA